VIRGEKGKLGVGRAIRAGVRSRGFAKSLLEKKKKREEEKIAMA